MQTKWKHWFWNYGYGLITNNSCADLESWGGGGQGVAIPPPAIKIIFHHPLERTSRSAHAIFENLKIKTEKNSLFSFYQNILRNLLCFILWNKTKNSRFWHQCIEHFYLIFTCHENNIYFVGTNFVSWKQFVERIEFYIVL